ncbi:hypothetical protein S245_038086, partial [Arachis hypogaea]
TRERGRRNRSSKLRRKRQRWTKSASNKGTAFVVLARLLASSKLVKGTLADHTFLLLGAGE